MYHKLEVVYHALLALALRLKVLTIAIALLVTLGAASLIPKLGMELIPPMNQGEFCVRSYFHLEQRYQKQITSFENSPSQLKTETM